LARGGVVAKSNLDKWVIKENRVKIFYKCWGDKKKDDDTKLKAKLQDELLALEISMEQGILTTDQLTRKSEIQFQLMKIWEQEEAGWKEKSNNNWLLKGDGNTEFFHRIANGRKRKNTIFSLQFEERIIEGDDNIIKHATKYYKNLFGTGDKPNLQFNPECWTDEEKVSLEEDDMLGSKFTEEEIKNAIFSMEKNTAHGPDHIPIEFYKKCKEIIKDDMMALFDDFFEGNLDISRMNYGMITLLPKLKDANKVQQYRPICLLNVKYKIYTKVLTIRMEKLWIKLLTGVKMPLLRVET